MKNFRLKGLLLTLVMTLTAFAASAVTFTVKVGNPAAVKCTVNGVNRELSTENDFDVAEYTGIQFTGVEPYYIKNVTNEHGTTANGYYQGTWNFYPSSYDDGSVYTIVTLNLDETRTSEFTINVDDPSLVRASLSGYNRTLNLNKDENKIKFDDLTENYLYLSSTNYSKPLYEVKLNEEKVEAQNGSYTINLTNGCTVDITAAIPDIDINVTFNYTSEEGKGAIKAVYVDQQEVTDFNGTSLTMKAGQSLGLANNPDYKITSVKFNGTPISWTGGYTYTQTLMADVEVEVDARPYGTFTATIDIDDPTNIVLYRGYQYNNDIISLNPGKNAIEVSEVNAVVSWKAADGCYITSVTADDNQLSEYQTDYTLTENATLTFVTGKIVMDKTAVVWVSDLSKANYYFSLQGSDRSNIYLENGYNILPFYEKMSPFMLGWAGENLTVSQVYLNGELSDPSYPGSSNWQLALEDGDVLKLFIGEEPVSCDVTFAADDDIEAEVTGDIITNIADWRSGFSCFKGTEVAVAGQGIKVSVNGSDIDADQNDKFAFTVSDTATNVKIERKDDSGVEDVAVDNISGDAPVYNLNGIRVATRATSSDLPAGIYIMDGKKFIVK